MYDYINVNMLNTEITCPCTGTTHNVEQMISEVWVIFFTGGAMSPVSLLYLLFRFPVEHLLFCTRLLKSLFYELSKI